MVKVPESALDNAMVKTAIVYYEAKLPKAHHDRPIGD